MKSPCLLLFICVTLAANNLFAGHRTIHVLVALCDNDYQGIVPVPKKIGNGDDPVLNLYWGAGYGTKTFFRRSAEWKLLSASRIDSTILERCVFQHVTTQTFLVADAYRGREIRSTVEDFFFAAAGARVDTARIPGASGIPILGGADLIVYLGHDGLMDFTLDTPPSSHDDRSRDVAVLACMSKQFFGPYLSLYSVNPVLLTSNLMAPEAYVLDALVTTWIAGKSKQQIRQAAGAAYSKYQKCSLKAGLGLFSTTLD